MPPNPASINPPSPALISLLLSDTAMVGMDILFKGFNRASPDS